MRRARQADEDSEQELWQQVSSESDWSKEERKESAWENVIVCAMQSDWDLDFEFNYVWLFVAIGVVSAYKHLHASLLRLYITYCANTDIDAPPPQTTATIVH